MKDTKLFLAGQCADLSSSTTILFNYTLTDTTKPQAVKNSFTKTVELPGTQNNNTIFGDIWDLSRLQSYGSGNYAGVTFNPLQKADFELYIDGDLYETGYFKLTQITKKDKDIKYSITLYGGLGEFLYNLMYSEGGNKLEFKDLQIVNDPYYPDHFDDIGFDITKETVKEAWDNINGSPSSKYRVVNFAPCYNGIPSDFDADHVLVNLSGRTNTLNNVTGISSYHRWATGECSRELTEWETRDLRSYLQRPVLNVYTLINTCRYPDNNGGYDVELDEHFFHLSNPYYFDAWITLDMIQNIQGEDETNSTSITGATMSYYNSWYTISANTDFSQFNDLTLDVAINFRPSGSTSATNLFTSVNKKINNTFTLQDRFVADYYNYFSSVLIQLIAYDEIDNVVATSTAYQLTSKIPIRSTGSYTAADLKDRFSNGGASIPEWKTLYGYFKRVNSNTYTWWGENGSEQHLKFTFPSATAFHTLKLRIVIPYSESYKLTFTGGHRSMVTSDGGLRFYSTTRETIDGNHEIDYVRNSQAATLVRNLSISSFNATATRYGGFTSGKHISHDRLLTLGITPAEFLLSYVKMFGLYMWKDPVMKKIYISDREGFYDKSNVVNLEDVIDRSKDIKITPQVAASKWYDFSTEQNESEANTQYKSTYGMDFGLQRVNTGYDFDSGKTEVYDGMFKGGVEVLERSPYYYDDYSGWPVYCYNGFTLKTFSTASGSLEGTDHTVNTKTGVNTAPLNPKYEGFDLFPKMQCHNASNDPSEGSLSLLFYRGAMPVTSITPNDVNYWLTDDLEEMVSLNDKTPCWISTNVASGYGGTSVGIKVDELPLFSRYISYPDTGYITHTWDYGKTMETYSLGLTLTDGCSVYERCWKNYIADMYDVNNRVVSCYGVIKGQVTWEWLRRFYYFDNSYWRLNSIKEWNPGSQKPTNLEFIKVIDLKNYGLDWIDENPIMDFYLPDYKPVYVSGETVYNVEPSTSSIRVVVEVQDGGPWGFDDGGTGGMYTVHYDNGTTDDGYYRDLTPDHSDTGYGNTMESFGIGPNTSGYGRTFEFRIMIFGVSGDVGISFYVRQESL